MIIKRTENRVLNGCLHRLRRFLLFLMFCSISIGASAQEIADHEIKAVFLYNFANFITWPADAFEQRSSPFNFCIIGRSKINDSLAIAIKDEVIKGRTLQLVELKSSTDISNCQILFINAIELRNQTEIISNYSGKATLIVGDTRDFISKGGMISLVQKKRRIHPMINLEAVSNVHMKVSSKLLRLATLTKNPKPWSLGP